MPHPKLLTAALLATSALLPRLAAADLWFAEPIVVHEWGVHVFDWAKQSPSPAQLPPFIHTAANPGLPAPAGPFRVKDLPPDNGDRDKPVLYFYPPDPMVSMSRPVIGVELRFAAGHTNAWYPQATTYRTPAMTEKAVAPDWDAWKKANPNRWNSRKTIPEPDDPRMELVWSYLPLTNDPPAGATLQRVADDHWITTARQTKSAYVTSGTETEKFLFYEGATRELPAFAIIPGEGNHVVNISEAPIYNVFAIYHHDHHTWVGYTSVLEPLKPLSSNHEGGAGVTITTLNLPNLANPMDWTDEKSLPALTTDRLVSALTEGNLIAIHQRLRDPADPQGPTQSAQLYPDEAQALEKIWHDDFFNSEGLTILYRESPATLDRAMPLNLYTDMYHYILLTRCGMVVTQNINVDQAQAAYRAVNNFPTTPGKDRDQALQTLKANHFATQSALTYLDRLGRDPKQSATLRAALEK